MADSISFTLPSPPSFNALTRNTTKEERARAAKVGKKLKGRRRTHAYNAWANAAGWEMRVDNQGRARSWEPLVGPVSVRILTGNARQDNDASPKAIFDLFTTMRVWNDDSQVKHHEVYYGGMPGKTVVTVTPLNI